MVYQLQQGSDPLLLVSYEADSTGTLTTTLVPGICGRLQFFYGIQAVSTTATGQLITSNIGLRSDAELC